MFPGHPIWDHEVFHHPLYDAFAKKVWFQHVNAPKSTREQQLAAAVPAVAGELQTLRQEQSHQLAALQRSVDEAQGQIRELGHQDQDLANQQRTFHLVPDNNGGAGGSLRGGDVCASCGCSGMAVVDNGDSRIPGSAGASGGDLHLTPLSTHPTA
jgi:hypothetical protein